MKGIGAYQAWRLGQDEAALSALMEAFAAADELGDTCLHRADLSPALLHAASQSPNVRVAGEYLWLQRTAAAEEALAVSIQSRLTPSPALPCPEEALQGLNTGQREALQLALKHRFCLLNGGPGTGKTYTMARIVAALRQALPEMRLALTAPTGKAAQRMQESLQAMDLKLEAEALTLHRLLAYRHGRFQYDARQPLPYDVIVVDEASMLSLDLARALFAAVKNDSRLIVLGDAQQLAAVDAGAVLRDLIEHPSLEAHRVTLWESKRFDDGSTIGRLARAALRGEALSCPTETLSDEALLLQPYQDYFAALRAEAPVPLLWHYFNHHRFLCASKQGREGVDTLNHLALQTLRALFPQTEAGVLHGTPLMLRVNQHRLGLFNGDVALCLRQDGRMMLHFPQREALPLSALNPQHLTPAFAMTVHKSQGSEYPTVSLFLPEQSRLLSRELLYTGITRAREHLRLFASESALKQALATVSSRRTGLAYFLSHGLD